MQNRLREMRQRASLTQEDLALRTGVTRQALSAIEKGAVIPNTATALTLAQIFHCRVEDLFFLDERPSFHMPGMRVGDPLILARIAGQTVVHAGRQEGNRRLDAVLPNARVSEVRGAHIRVMNAAYGAHPDEVFLVAGCDSALGLWVQAINLAAGKTVAYWINCDNQTARAYLAEKRVHAVATHFGQGLSFDEDKEVKARLQFTRYRLGFGFAGERFAPPDAERIKAMRLVNRPRGAGARQALDRWSHENDAHVDTLAGYDVELPSHAHVAEAVACRFADLGVMPEPEAYACNLDFVSLSEDSSVLSFAVDLVHPVVSHALQTLASDRFLATLKISGPYDVSTLGRMLT
ncbi:helix-turn-helix transcriptional regulator [Ferroacidibacillus organovorans]|uniref:HTH cro/C1-type domain-containing protein n=1 Tax=Ferroacidibacillus organovorans TaxID=1765683 RepID=A0A853KBF2_9BACL|nr:helix-turn-helix transcriptional regulator [Ferroacidibacillus organovorans]KYP81056.1 hypothetical protein AYJ22_08985 [Ferroacidibacillus organovorans]OAG93684.1 hypothetical protein AYW79_09245 [Ferroacidibacillus organovorans]